MEKTLKAPPHIRSESDKKPEVRVVKLDTPVEPVVQQFHYGKIRRPGEGDYAATRAKYGALAATDDDRAAKTRKDARFSINHLLREPLAVEEEERRVIEEKVRARVDAISEDARTKAAEAGYQEGLKTGHQEAFAKFREEGSETLARFERFLSQAEGAKQDIFKANERYLLELVFRLARLVTLKELSTDRDYVLRLARELIERTGVRENIRLKINPAELEGIAMLKEGLERELGTLKNLHIEPSAAVASGGCQVETEWSAIDASLEAQFRGLREGLLGEANAQDVASDAAQAVKDQDPTRTGTGTPSEGEGA